MRSVSLWTGFCLFSHFHLIKFPTSFPKFLNFWRHVHSDFFSAFWINSYSKRKILQWILTPKLQVALGVGFSEIRNSPKVFEWNFIATEWISLDSIEFYLYTILFRMVTIQNFHVRWSVLELIWTIQNYCSLIFCI